MWVGENLDDSVRYTNIPKKSVQGRDARGRFLPKNSGELNVGKPFETEVEEIVREISDPGTTAAQIRIKTQSGKTVVVDVGAKRRGIVKLTEAKGSATAHLSENQRPGYPEIQESGGVVVGSGSPQFPAGTFIPPTKVRVIRPTHVERLRRLRAAQRGQ